MTADRRMFGASAVAKRESTPVEVRVPGKILFAACERLGVGEGATTVLRFWYESSFTGDPGPKRFFRAFATGEKLPADAVWCRSAVDGEGCAWHLYELPFQERS